MSQGRPVYKSQPQQANLLQGVSGAGQVGASLAGATVDTQGLARGFANLAAKIQQDTARKEALYQTDQKQKYAKARAELSIYNQDLLTRSTQDPNGLAKSISAVAVTDDIRKTSQKLAQSIGLDKGNQELFELDTSVFLAEKSPQWAKLEVKQKVAGDQYEVNTIASRFLLNAQNPRLINEGIVSPREDFATFNNLLENSRYLPPENKDAARTEFAKGYLTNFVEGSLNNIELNTSLSPEQKLTALESTRYLFSSEFKDLFSAITPSESFKIQEEIQKAQEKQERIIDGAIKEQQKLVDKYLEFQTDNIVDSLRNGLASPDSLTGLAKLAQDLFNKGEYSKGQGIIEKAQKNIIALADEQRAQGDIEGANATLQQLNALGGLTEQAKTQFRSSEQAANKWTNQVRENPSTVFNQQATQNAYNQGFGTGIAHIDAEFNKYGIPESQKRFIDPVTANQIESIDREEDKVEALNSIISQAGNKKTSILHEAIERKLVSSATGISLIFSESNNSDLMNGVNRANQQAKTNRDYLSKLGTSTSKPSEVQKSIFNNAEIQQMLKGFNGQGSAELGNGIANVIQNMAMDEMVSNNKNKDEAIKASIKKIKPFVKTWKEGGQNFSVLDPQNKINANEAKVSMEAIRKNLDSFIPTTKINENSIKQLGKAFSKAGYTDPTYPAKFVNGIKSIGSELGFTGKANDIFTAQALATMQHESSFNPDAVNPSARNGLQGTGLIQIMRPNPKGFKKDPIAQLDDIRSYLKKNQKELYKKDALRERDIKENGAILLSSIFTGPNAKELFNIEKSNISDGSATLGTYYQKVRDYRPYLDDRPFAYTNAVKSTAKFQLAPDGKSFNVIYPTSDSSQTVLSKAGKPLSIPTNATETASLILETATSSVSTAGFTPKSKRPTQNTFIPSSFTKSTSYGKGLF